MEKIVVFDADTWHIGKGFLDDHVDGGGNYGIRFGRKRAVKFDVFRLDKMRKNCVGDNKYLGLKGCERAH
ncbi:hypothetical protein P8452_24714 [Trifolium repens]|nr:hypothetical protein P8452_24714 [Trifolium repens]